MLCKMKKLRLLVIVTSCVLLTGAIFPGKLFAEIVIEDWAARYNGPPGNRSDIPTAIAMDSSGNVYVTGWSWGIGSYDDYATIKYDTNGNELWAARYNGPENYTDTARAIAVDALGNVYVTGSSDGSGTGYDYATIKYDSSGNQLWVVRYNGPGNSRDLAYAIAVDSSGNVYVTGHSTGSGTGQDYATVKYDAIGNEIWAARYNGPGNSGDAAFAIALDSSGNVYVTGQSTGSGTYNDYATIMYDSSGNQLWAARYNDSGDQDLARFIALDASGNVYVAGRSYGSGTGWDYATIKYDAIGNENWVARYNGPANDYEHTDGMAVDTSGNVYVTGFSTGSGTGRDYATVKYDAIGNEIWVARYNGPANSLDWARAIAMDSSGNVYVTGWSYGVGTSDYATIKYDTDGNENWVARYNGPAKSIYGAHAIALDGSENVYVTGASYAVGSNYDYVTLKYSQVVNQPPVAVCQDVTVMADSYCEGVVAPEDVNDGSSDPDGDPITLSLSPEGPYPIGTTAVTLTVTDDQGRIKRVYGHGESPYSKRGYPTARS